MQISYVSVLMRLAREYRESLRIDQYAFSLHVIDHGYPSMLTRSGRMCRTDTRSVAYHVHRANRLHRRVSEMARRHVEMDSPYGRFLSGVNNKVSQ